MIYKYQSDFLIFKAKYTVLYVGSLRIIKTVFKLCLRNMSRLPLKKMLLTPVESLFASLLFIIFLVDKLVFLFSLILLHGYLLPFLISSLVR